MKRIIFEVDDEKLLSNLRADNGIIGPLGYLVVEAMLSGESSKGLDADRMAEYGVVLSPPEAV